MKLDNETVQQLASHLEQAELNAQDVVKITDAHPDMDFDDAYAIQYAIRKMKTGRGQHFAGLKMGLTSRAKMTQMGVDTPIFGFLMDYMARGDGEEIRFDELIHPKIEPEIAFVTRTDLRGPGCHIGDVLLATDFVLPAMEVIDSRYRDFKFDLKSVIADNTSGSRFVAGGHAGDPRALDLRTLGVVLEKNGEVVATGAGAAVLGHPANSVAMLANMLGARGEHIPTGTYIMTGAVTEAVAVAKGDSVTARFGGLGSVSVRFV
jgi:2-oxo-3-hexenedioate decarboxylase